MADAGRTARIAGTSTVRSRQGLGARGIEGHITSAASGSKRDGAVTVRAGDCHRSRRSS